VLSFEFEPPREQGLCACCGGRIIALTRFVHRDGDAYAVYLATFSDNHQEKVVSLVAGLGDWGEGTTAVDRVAIAMQLRCTDTGFAVAVVDGSSTPWSGAAFLGHSLTREEALAHPFVDDAFHLTDHIVVEDEPIRKYLEGRENA
jgi:hypothetical protein